MEFFSWEPNIRFSRLLHPGIADDLISTCEQVEGRKVIGSSTATTDWTFLPNQNRRISSAQTLGPGSSMSDIPAYSPRTRRRMSNMILTGVSALGDTLTSVLSRSSSNLLDAKSISEQLERIQGSLPDPNRGLPRLEYATLEEILPESILRDIAQTAQKDQQYLIWELVTTEHSHLKQLSAMINTFKEAMERLQLDGFLSKIDKNVLFLNIEEIRNVHLSFWDHCIQRLIDAVKETGDPLDVDILAECQCALFEKEDNPLFDYCTEVLASKDYMKGRQEKSTDFKDFVEYTKVNQFVKSLDMRMEEKEEQRKIAGVKERIESYNAVTVHTSHVNEQVQQVLDRYNKFELTDMDPVLRKQRRFLHEVPVYKRGKCNGEGGVSCGIILSSKHRIKPSIMPPWNACTECKECDAGFYCPDVGATAFDPDNKCQKGYYCESGVSTPTPVQDELENVKDCSETDNVGKGNICEAGNFCEEGSAKETPGPAAVLGNCILPKNQLTNTLSADRPDTFALRSGRAGRGEGSGIALTVTARTNILVQK
eukprot:sb/3463699/